MPRWVRLKKYNRFFIYIFIFFIAHQAHAARSLDEFLSFSQPHPSLAEILNAYPADCYNREWIGHGALYGASCQASRYGDPSRATTFYSDFILDQKRVEAEREASSDNTSEHQNEYLQKIMRLGSEMAAYVLIQRGPKDLTSTEVKYFEEAVLAKGIRESFLIHYRTRLNPIENLHPLMITVGDFDDYRHLKNPRAYGFSQVNERFHDVPLDFRFDLITNIAYGVNFFSSAWLKAKDATCVKNFEKYLGDEESEHLYWAALSRAAYSFYNGGSNYCRFLVSDRIHNEEPLRCQNSVSCRNDSGYLKELISIRRGYYSEFNDSNTVQPLNFQCFLERGSDYCLKQDKSIDFLQSRVVYLDNGAVCRRYEDKNDLYCVDDIRLAGCLNEQFNVSGHKFGLLNASDLKGQLVYERDRNKLCTQSVPHLYSVGSLVQPQKNILLRDEIGAAMHRRKANGSYLRSPKGEKLSLTVRAGEIYQVLDFKVEPMIKDGEIVRRYKVMVKNDGEMPQAGYIYAGQVFSDKADENYVTSWVQPVPSPSEVKIETLTIPMPGTRIRLKKESQLLSFSKTSKEPQVMSGESLPPGREFTVGEIQVHGSNHKVYAFLSFDGSASTAIYIGQLDGDSTISEYIEIIDHDPYQDFLKHWPSYEETL